MGKTFLIRNLFGDKGIYIESTGEKDASYKELNKYSSANRQIFLSMITTKGLKHNIYSEELVASQVLLKDFF